MNPLKQLHDFGQSVWLDYIRRSLITSGELKRMIEEDGLRGVTSNPAIFEKAITGSNDYADVLEASRQQHVDAMQSYERIALGDIRDAADVLRPVYEDSGGHDGYVSLEVSPYLARDTGGTVREAKRLWAALERENVMIKVPATEEGIPAVAELIAEGISVNVTLIFSQAIYDQVAAAYVEGLERFRENGGDLSKVASVASVFVSRLDAAVEAALEERGVSGSDGKAVLGKVAIANAKLAYQRWKTHFAGEDWERLKSLGAQTQRLLWASTGTKNPEYRDVLYVEELVGTDTVNTIPPATFDAFRDHGKVRATLEEDADGARRTLEQLAELGIDLDSITDDLLEQGLRQFSQAFDKLLRAVDFRCTCASEPKVSHQALSLPEDLAASVEATLARWTEDGSVRRLWARDASLWTGSGEGDWLGWLGATADHASHGERLARFAAKVEKAGYSHILLLGMGGSSLCPDVLRSTFGKLDGFPELHVVDSTDPAQVAAKAARVDLANTLFIVSSKSGSTLEPNIFKQYFFHLVRNLLGEDEAGSRFVAITDPGSKLHEVARKDGFHQIFFGLPSIGGRYSALSDFGMVPAAAMGIDAAKFLDRADEMAVACSACVPAEENPGAVLGVVLGEAGLAGRDKVTLITSPEIATLGAWLEQLLAESTGKSGRGLIPVDGEQPGKPEVYGEDRLFVYLRLDTAPDAQQDDAVAALEEAGHPVVRIPIADIYDLGREFFRWEIATAVAGSVLGLNPFDQPDVEASKLATKALTTQYEDDGSLPADEPFLVGDEIELFADPENVEELHSSVRRNPSGEDLLGAHLGRLGAGDYFGVLAYVEMSRENESVLQALRDSVRNKLGVATVLGFGPRFLHSTGQAYKGGPNTGVFLQVTCDDTEDIPVPGQEYTFGLVKTAQARGDFEVLAERGRRALRVHVNGDVTEGLKKLEEYVRQALG
jgi:transaldolase/glucose-6-phosphate isomerase